MMEENNDIQKESMIEITEEEYDTMNRAMLFVMYMKDIIEMLGEFEL